MWVKHIGLWANVESAILDAKSGANRKQTSQGKPEKVKTVEIRNCKGLERVTREGSE